MKKLRETNSVIIRVYAVWTKNKTEMMDLFFFHLSFLPFFREHRFR